MVPVGRLFGLYSFIHSPFGAWIRMLFSNGQALYRLYNPNALAGSHHYTTSAEERDFLASLGWQKEGVGWYGVK